MTTTTTRPRPCHPHPDDHTRRLQGHRHGGDHHACEPCTEHHCAVCGWRHTDDQHPRTCATCVGGIRDDLTEITRLHAALPTEATHHARDSAPGAKHLNPMGGDPMTLAIGRHFRPAERAQLRALAAYGDHADDLLDSDPTPPLLVLATYEDQWRAALGKPTDDRATVARACTYLDQNLTLMAQAYRKFTEFAHDIRQLRTQLEAVTRDGTPRVTGVPCFECGADLRQVFDDPKPCRCGPRPVLEHAAHGSCTCPVRTVIEAGPKGEPVTVRIGGHIDGLTHPAPGLCCLACRRLRDWDRRHAGHGQGGRRDRWRCPGCRREYTDPEYRLAVSAAHDEANPLRTANQIAATLGLSPSTLRTWANRGHIDRRGRDQRGRVLYDVEEVRRHAAAGGLLAS